MQENVVLTRQDGRVSIIQLNRPLQMNALNDAGMDALGTALLDMDQGPNIGCIIIPGSAKPFAAGADDGVRRKTQARFQA